MTIKHSKFLFVAGVISSLIAVFMFGNSILEFTNVLHTKAHTVTQTIGVQLSYLIFVNTIILLATGLVSIVYKNSLKFINLRIFMGIIALSWPLFLSVTLFFTQLKINIRLLILCLTSLIYVVAVLVVKITNFESSKGIKLNPSQMIAQSGKRGKTVNINSMMNVNTGKVQAKSINHALGQIATTMKTNKSSGFKLDRLFAGRRRKMGGGIFNRIYTSGHRRRNTNFLTPLLRTLRGRRRR